MRFAIFPLHLSKVLRLPRKSDARSYKVLHLSRKIISANLKIWCSKMQPLSGNQRPGPPNSSDEHVSCIAHATENASLQILFTCPMRAIVFGQATNLHILLTFDKVHNPLRLPRKTTLQRPKVVRACGVFCILHILTSKCASRHNSVHFLNISTSKSAPRLMCFVHFDLEMCFKSQRCAIFHLSSGQLASHPPLWQAYFSTLWSHKSLEKNTVFRDFPTFSFFWDFLFFDLLSSSLLFSDSSHLCF